MRVLVGDIGGTKTGLAVAQVDGDRVTLDEQRRYPSAEFDSLEAIVRRYLDQSGGLGDGRLVGAFAIAGPVHDDRGKTTNLPWEVDARRLESSLGLDRARLLNDLEAQAWGVPALAPEQMAELHPGAGESGNACVVAAGTGLGEAGMFWDGKRYHPFATEGGHTDFAPVDEREYALLGHLQGRLGGRVSWERVVSGMGIGNIFEFLLEWRRTEAPAWLLEEIGDQDPVPAVARAAAGRECPICVETMQLFARLYGREAGNMGLKQMALGGVYLGGGVAPKNLELLRQGEFLRGFFGKGRMEPLMRRMPVRVILEPDTPLFGAARFMAV